MDRSPSPAPRARQRRSFTRSPTPLAAREKTRSPTPPRKVYSRSRSRSYEKKYKSRSRSPKRTYYSRSRSRTPAYTSSRGDNGNRDYERRDSRDYERSSDRGRRGGFGGNDREPSPSYSKGGSGYYSRRKRSRSRSPGWEPGAGSGYNNRRKQNVDREDPEPSRCVGVFGLSLYTQERHVRDVFAKYGPIENIQIVYDRQSGRSRGFGFVYYDDVADSMEAKERCNGIEIDGRRIRVDYSVTKRAHTPTPGVYMGRAGRGGSSRGGGGGGGDDYNRDRSPRGYGGDRGGYGHSSRYSKSRSRSFSPRRY